jgi:hypothetical protein
MRSQPPNNAFANNREYYAPARVSYPRSAVIIKALVTALLAIALLSPTLSPIAHAATAQIVAITLQDTSVDPSNSAMMIKTDTAKVKAGRVTLEAVNLSKDLTHEVLVVPALSEGGVALRHQDEYGRRKAGALARRDFRVEARRPWQAHAESQTRHVPSVV